MPRRRSFDRPEGEIEPYSAGTFNRDGSWRAPNENEGQGPVRDERWRFIDSLVAVRMDLQRRVPPAEFARQIAARWPRHVDMFGSVQIAPGTLLGTLDLWAKLDRFEDWDQAPCPTSASCAVRDGGLGPFSTLVNGRSVDRREVIQQDDEIDPAVAGQLASDLAARMGWSGTVSSKSESSATPTSGELLETVPRASLEVSLFPEPDQE